MNRIDGKRPSQPYASRRAAVALCLALAATTLLAIWLPVRSGVLGAPLDDRYRFGFGVKLQKGQVEDYDVDELRAGWYVDWLARANPARPAGMEYVQMVRLHQLTECWPERTGDREACPYVEPYTYTLTSPKIRVAIASIAQDNPGSLWLIGNEMDRMDWDNPPGGQDEMLPELYAVAYHDLYHFIKSNDPTARVAIGGVIQPTPCRLKYLDIVWQTYQDLYHVPMPVDVWNIHNMILTETEFHGAQMPPGIDKSMCEAEGYSTQDADNVEIFKQHIVDFRQWMEDKGEGEKPLIISEYSVLYPERLGFDEARVIRYLCATFDYLTTATDASLGYPADDDRLVQRWAWYSLNDAAFEGYDPSWHHLFDPDTQQITRLGINYGTRCARGPAVYLPIVLSSYGP